MEITLAHPTHFKSRGNARSGGASAEPQAGMGIASFVIALISLLNVLLIIVVKYAVRATWQEAPVEGSPITYLVGTWIFGTGLLAVTGIVFGVGGLLQKQRRRRPAVLGLIINVAVPLLLMFYLVIMMAFGAPAPGAASEPVTWDQREWDSPLASGLRWTTVILALAAGWMLWKKWQRIKPEETAPRLCTRCRKPLSGTARFCRRCGETVLLTNSGLR